MQRLKFVNAALLALGTVLASPATAMTNAPALSSPGLPVIDVQRDCHRDVRRHYVPEYGRSVWHYHRNNCAPVRADPPREEEPIRRDCHRDVQRHFLPQYGARVYHRHVGPNCRARVYERGNQQGGNGGNCIRIGPIQYCEN